MYESQKEEQKKYLNENKAVYRFVKSRGWVIAKNKLMEKIDDLQSIMNVDGKTPEEVVMDIKVRKLVCNELLDWVRSLEGQAQQFENNETLLPREQKDYIIREE